MPQTLLPTLLIQWRFDFQTIDWRVASVLVALVGLFLVLYFQWWRNRKSLSYEVLSNEMLVSAEKGIQDKVEIRYEGYSVKNVRLLVVKLINDGYLPIKKEDFQKEIKFQFPGAKILTAEKIKFQPENIGTQLAYRDDWLTVDPVLFNRKDYIKFKLLLTECDDMKVDARIIGVSDVREVKRRFYENHFVFIFIAMALFTLITTFLRPGTVSYVLLILVVFLILVPDVLSTYRRNKEREP